MTQSMALELVKLAHNAVRSVNRFLGSEIVDRWIDRDILTGEWNRDRRLFQSVWSTFSIAGEDQYGGSAQQAYSTVRPVVLKKQQAVAGRVKRG